MKAILVSVDHPPPPPPVESSGVEKPGGDTASGTAVVLVVEVDVDVVVVGASVVVVVRGRVVVVVRGLVVVVVRGAVVVVVGAAVVVVVGAVVVVVGATVVVVVVVGSTWAPAGPATAHIDAAASTIADAPSTANVRARRRSVGVRTAGGLPVDGRPPGGTRRCGVTLLPGRAGPRPPGAPRRPSHRW
jgi:hypothetical protein